jgi:hypothetical protein
VGNEILRCSLSAATGNGYYTTYETGAAFRRQSEQSGKRVFYDYIRYAGIHRPRDKYRYGASGGSIVDKVVTVDPFARQRHEYIAGFNHP